MIWLLVVTCLAVGIGIGLFVGTYIAAKDADFWLDQEVQLAKARFVQDHQDGHLIVRKGIYDQEMES